MWMQVIKLNDTTLPISVFIRSTHPKQLWVVQMWFSLTNSKLHQRAAGGLWYADLDAHSSRWGRQCPEADGEEGVQNKRPHSKLSVKLFEAAADV